MFCGITVIVVNTIVGGPAERVGVMPNDRIVRIDTLDARGLQADRRAEAPARQDSARGSKSTSCATGSRPPLHFVIVRDKIPLNTVDAAYMAADGVGYIKVNRFGRTTMSEFREAFDKLGRPESPDSRPAGQRRRIAGAGGRNGRGSSCRGARWSSRPKDAPCRRCRCAIRTTARRPTGLWRC